VIEGINDSAESARALAALLKGSDAHVNLIDINEGSQRYGKNGVKTVERFAGLLENLNVNYTVRRKLGSSINAACGQLKAQYSKK
jgi:23S rRNA (adenine2503-C2)-methyltransferase